MSQAEPQTGESDEAQPDNQEADGSIVITNTPDDEAEPSVEEETESELEEEASSSDVENSADDAEEQEDMEAEPEVEADAEPTVDEDDDQEADAEAEDAEDSAPEEEAEDDGDADVDDEAAEAAEVDHPPRHFEATIEASSFATALDSVSVLVDECKIRTSPDGLSIRAVDPANVGMADLDLQAEAFENFKTSDGVIGVDLGRLEDVIGLAGSGDLVTFDLDVETRKLHVHIDGIEYTLALIDPSSIRKEPDIPDLNLPCEVVIESKHMSRAVKASNMVGDYIEFESAQDGRTNQLIIKAEGDTDDVELVLEGDDIVAYPSYGEARSIFSLDYVKDFNKALPKKSEVRLRLGSEFPLKVDFEALDGHMETTYMLAPRIQSD